MNITITIPDAHLPRVKALAASWFAPEDVNGNPYTPTDAELLAEFKRRIREWIKGEVQQYELLEEHKNVFANYVPLDATAS